MGHEESRPCDIQRFLSLAVKIENFNEKKKDILILLLKTYILVLVRTASPRRGGSNEYPQCTFWIKNKTRGPLVL